MLSKNAQSQPDYAQLFRGRPKRFVLPLHPTRDVERNLNRLPYSESTALWRTDGSIYVRPDELCPLGCETPRINYDVYNGIKYRYFYAISSDVDANNPGTVDIDLTCEEHGCHCTASFCLLTSQMIKVDTMEKKCWTWAEPNVYASEPVFIARPGAEVGSSIVLLFGEESCIDDSFQSYRTVRR